MPELGLPELLIVLVIVVLLFGPSKAADLGSSLGKSIREFRKESHEDSHPQLTAPAAMDRTSETSLPASRSPSPTARFCTNCGSAASSDQKFCVECGLALQE